MIHRPTVERIASAIIVPYAAATCAAFVVILSWTQDAETIGIGLLAPLLAVPAIVGHVVTSICTTSRRWRRALYWILATPMPLYLLSVALFPSEAARSDASDQWAVAFLLPLLAAGIVGY